MDLLLSDEKLTGPSTPGDIYWTLGDNLNTVRDIARYDPQNDTTTIVNHRVFDAFGNLTSESAPAVDLIFAFTGRLFDESTGLQNNLHRWYDAPTGRWLSEDPISFSAGDANLYRYVNNGPTYASDPSGLNKILDAYAARIRGYLQANQRWSAAKEAWDMYWRMATNADLLGESLAGSVMEHWLNGTGTVYTLTGNQVYGAITDKSGPYQRLWRFWENWNATHLGDSGDAQTDWIYLTATQGVYHHALGGFWVRFSGRWSWRKWTFTVDGKWELWDEYSWKPGLTTLIDGTIIEDNWGRLVQEEIKNPTPKPFEIKGEWSGKITFDLNKMPPVKATTRRLGGRR